MLVDDYYPIAVFVLVAIMFPVLAFVTAKFFRPTKYSTLRDTTYECGMEPIGQAQIQFHVQFYIYALVFVLFDIVTVFLLVWALTYSDALSSMDLLGQAGFSALAFIAIGLVGVYYALKKEAILWI
ncbi:MAG TPA: NADH-quinone oxidoreductase subunit A [Methanomassiliicoccales archaeon]|jgi:NADH:ubiquinone oxidoreductase subunit 3 (subunit A)